MAAATTIVDGSSNGSVPRLSLSMDNSVFLASSLNVLSDVPEDKLKVLEYRLVNNPHAKNIETVVGFGENSKDKSYPVGTLLQNGNSRDMSSHIVNESSTDKSFVGTSERSRDKSYIPGAPVIRECSKDKVYVPGAPVTPVKPCVNAALAEAASRPGKDDILRTSSVSVRPPIAHTEAHSAERNSLSHREGDLVCNESMERQSHLSQAVGVLGGALDSEHFSTEELETSDEDSQGSASSKSNQGLSTIPSGIYAHSRDDDDGIHSVERKRKLFSSDDVGIGIIGSTSSKGESRGHTSERAPKKGHKSQMKRSKTSSDVLSLDAHAQRVSERSPPKVPRTITHFFAPSGPLNPTTSASDASAPLPGTPTGCRSQQLAEKDRDLAGREADLEAKERALVEREKEIARREASQAKFEEEALQRAAAVSREERAQAEGLRRQHDQRVTDTMKGLLVARAREERALISARLCSDTARVGRVGYIRSGLSVSEVWEDGTAWSDLIRRGEELEAEESRLERDKKAFAKRCKSSNSAGSSAANAGGVGMPPPPVPSDEQAEQEEIYRLRMQKVRDKKKMLQEEKEKLEREKYSLIREIKRVQDQNRSKYNSFPLLNKRYLLLHLLGKGGFSEVYKAFDLLEMQEVACKIHELNCQWSEEKKTNYMKHATREYEIQKKLCHQRIVRLLDVFEVSSDGFCTVLEYCDGGDLEQVLKAQRILPEREARSIIMQVFAGLRYLNDQKHRVIHYDLKPANILFHNGEVKISDFGLSKIMDESEGGSMELTSQGAGTYWYLPPECFEVGHAPPKISSKVDVWSAGVIFYQMLFGVKPFGHGMSQEKMLIEQTITKSTCVHFPEGKDVPRVSDRAKEFMRKCLAYQQADRPDVLAVFQDPYLRHTGRQASTAGT